MGLTASADCNADAELIILEHGLTLDHIERVESDCIVYVNALKHARTLWLHRPERGKLRIKMVTGFELEPPEGWHDEKPGDRIGAPVGT